MSVVVGTEKGPCGKDLMMENMCVRTERAALERGLEQLEVQLARRQNERVSLALVGVEGERTYIHNTTTHATQHTTHFSSLLVHKIAKWTKKRGEEIRTDM